MRREGHDCGRVEGRGAHRDPLRGNAETGLGTQAEQEVAVSRTGTEKQPVIEIATG